MHFYLIEFVYYVSSWNERIKIQTNRRYMLRAYDARHIQTHWMQIPYNCIQYFMVCYALTDQCTAYTYLHRILPIHYKNVHSIFPIIINLRFCLNRLITSLYFYLSTVTRFVTASIAISSIFLLKYSSSETNAKYSPEILSTQRIRTKKNTVEHRNTRKINS